LLPSASQPRHKELIFPRKGFSTGSTGVVGDDVVVVAPDVGEDGLALEVAVVRLSATTTGDEGAAVEQEVKAMVRPVRVITT
jgi:hypothetical protein